MSFAKGVLATLLIFSVQAFAEPTYIVPADANVNNKIVIAVNGETGAVEYQKADGTFQALNVMTAEQADQAQVQLAQYVPYYPNQMPCCGVYPPPQQYYPPPCGNCQPQPYYYQQGNLYADPCGNCGYRRVRPPRVHVRKYKERQLYEYDVIPQDNGYYEPDYDSGY